jgi:hypothetical protein
MPEAHGMASLLRGYLELFIPLSVTVTNGSTTFATTIISKRDHLPQRGGTLAEVGPLRFYAATGRLNAKHMLEHAALARDMMWRTNLSLCPFERYEHIWPSFTDEYESDHFNSDEP